MRTSPSLVLVVQEDRVEHQLTEALAAARHAAVQLRLVAPPDARIVDGHAGQRDGASDHQVHWLGEAGQQHQDHAQYDEDDGQGEVHPDGPRQIGLGVAQPQQGGDAGHHRQPEDLAEVVDESEDVGGGEHDQRDGALVWRWVVFG